MPSIVARVLVVLLASHRDETTQAWPLLPMAMGCPRGFFQLDIGEF
jgi:hypothetical protein